MNIKITAYNAICNLGNNIDIIYQNALNGNIWGFNFFDNYIKGKWLYLASINEQLPEIKETEYNIKCNRLILKTIKNISQRVENVILKYGKNRVAIVCASTNSGVEEFETSQNRKHFELGNPAEFIHAQLELNSYYTTVSTACSSGLKAFSLARNIINSDIADCVIVISVDTLAKVPLYGFNSLEVLSNRPSLPFSKNRNGMNIGEACAIFVLEQNTNTGIEIMGIGETSDIYHSTTPNPKAEEAIEAINKAMNEAKITISDVDYINAHGTGTIANDIMEAQAIYSVFGENTPVSSTKPLTGHCLGAAAGIETALCCKLIDSFNGYFYPHIYDGEYDEKLPKIKLVQLKEKFQKCNVCMCNSFGFGGANAILILGKNHEK